MKTKLYIILFLIIGFFCAGRKDAIAVVSIMLKETPKNVRKIRVFVYLENDGRASICKDLTQVECQTAVRSFFEPAIKRYFNEFGILISIDKIESNWLVTYRSLLIFDDDKKNFSALYMYQESLRSFTLDILRKIKAEVDVVVGCAESLPPGSSDLANNAQGTILLNLNDPDIKRSIIHEFGHIFCAKDNRKKNNIMNGLSGAIDDPFLREDTDAIFRNKFREFPKYSFECQ